jgi:hypothetical protein
VKTGSSDPADFAMTRHLIRRLWHDMPRDLALYVTAGRFWRIFFCDGRDMSTVAQTIARSAKNRQWIRCRVVANPPDLEAGFYIYGWTIYCMDRCFEMGDF